MSARRPLRTLGWPALVALIELCTRALVYALAPAAPQRLTGELGGPGPVLVTLIAGGLAVALSAALVALATMGARERWALSERRGEPAPRLALRPLLLRAALLWLASAVVFTAVENYVHLRAGMGIHGLSCLVGPVHRNAIPVTGALSLLAAAASAAAALLAGWMRRRIATALGVRVAAAPARLQHLTFHVPGARVRLSPGGPRPRGPPLAVV